MTPDTAPRSAYTPTAAGSYRASALTRGPWDDAHQHGGPPIALVCRAIEAVAAAQGLGHIARLTANLLRPVPIGELAVEVQADYVGRNAGHYSARLCADGKELLRCTALAQREAPLVLPPGLPGHPLPQALAPPQDCVPAVFPFAGRVVGYADLVEGRLAGGTIFKGPSAIWFRLRQPLVDGESASPYQRVAVAADSGNGISAVLDLRRYLFVNADLTINLLRRPRGEWIGVDAHTLLGPDGSGLAESALYDEAGRIGRATQSLTVRPRGG